MGDILKLGLILLLITSITALVLGYANDMTKDVIVNVENQASEVARKEVLPLAESFKSLDKEILNKIINENPNIKEIYSGYSENGDLVGYTIKTATPGYGGDVEVITGISLENKITGIKVVSHKETPGLGANATQPKFQNQFKDKSVSKELEVVKGSTSSENEIQALTGATITSKAVTKGVNLAREIFINNLAK
ncbi:RnfABCDGE type electron transport complex subunit G [Caloranaerobacter azorensis]|uniref:Ion-translocating oxidoreductase complex subunit G n=2 Tax=Caloranaerobacter azorensis TaxID=116090 RepID=A0A096BJ28_9FIRM|nr:RnfABCDGE type electron transport complex subunit G [Caloranaerobacter azorensis]KGG81190.1 electron transporter RnfG [Caloranaerobacter azorensis H53214]QIB26603.1 RnfABCDGE type electron transport complex subunit G [Caloranaerobacter azorensis]